MVLPCLMGEVRWDCMTAGQPSVLGWQAVLCLKFSKRLRASASAATVGVRRVVDGLKAMQRK